MPVMPPPPVSVVIAAPINLIDRLIEVGSLGDGSATRRRGRARRHARKADAQADQCCDEDCTHFSLSLRPQEAPTERLPCSGVWRPRAAVRDSVGGAARSSVDRLVAKSPRTATTNAIGSKATPCSPNNAWLDHSSLVHCRAWH